MSVRQTIKEKKTIPAPSQLMMRSPIITLTLLSLLNAGFKAVHAQEYSLLKDYSGKTFFDDWTFISKFDDLMNGDASFLDREAATSKKLAYVNGDGRAIIKVDDFSTVTGAMPGHDGYKRDTIRIESKQKFAFGSVWIADFVHLPYGCAVWPAYWSTYDTGKGIWPQGGEIDIVEGVNLMSANQMALHTTDGCLNTAQQPRGIAAQNNNCSIPAGCAVGESSSNSFGKGFSDAGGGVWATRFEKEEISIYFWSRKDIPASVTAAASNPKAPITNFADWGQPSAVYNTGCDIPKYFLEQTIVLDITLCGDWAGNAEVYAASGCKRDKPSCYEDHVVGDGSNFKDAYFEIGYIRTYGTAGSLIDSGTTTTSGGKPAATGNSTTGGKSAAARMVDLEGGMGAVLASAVLGLFGLLW